MAEESTKPGSVANPKDTPVVQWKLKKAIIDEEKKKKFGLQQSPTDTYLYRIRRQMSNKDSIQIESPQISDCTGWMGAEFANTLSCTDAYARSQRDPASAEKFIFEEAVTEAIYANSRINKQMLGQDGSTGVWIFEALRDFGVITRLQLQQLGYAPAYSSKRARLWGDHGIPKDLPIGRKLKTVTAITTFDQAVIFIDNGYPIGVCSDQGFDETRDEDGFCKPSGTWNHAMLFNATRKSGTRPGLGICQWRKTHTVGWHDAPPSFWWVDADVADRMLAKGDSHTGSFYTGYESRYDIF